MNEYANLSESAIRFAKANEGMYKAKPKIKKSKIDITKEKATRERPQTKLNLSKKLCELHIDKPRKDIITILVNTLSLNHATATVYACLCNKMLKSENSDNKSTTCL